MKKLRLDPDELVVESFAVQRAAHWMGTVQGNVEREGEQRERPGFFSWLFSCATGCRDTCQVSCGYTCGLSCNDTACEHASVCHDYPTTMSRDHRCPP